MKVLFDLVIHAQVHSGSSLYMAWEDCRKLRRKTRLNVLMEFNGYKFEYHGQPFEAFRGELQPAAKEGK